MLREWLIGIVEELQVAPASTPEENGQRMASVLAVLCCIHSLCQTRAGISHDQFSLKFAAECFAMLLLQPNIEKQTCVDLDMVLNLMPLDSTKENVAKALLSYSIYLHEKQDLQQPQWLNLIPLIHFLRKESVPFGLPEMQPDKIKWDSGDDSRINEVKRKTKDKDNIQ